MEFDLSQIEKNPAIISALIDRVFGCDVSSASKIGQGFYGAVYLVLITKEPYRIIIKWYKHSGRNSAEHRQLDLLRRYSLIKIPEIYFVHNNCEAVPFDALLMEYIDGINASKLLSDHPNRESFADEIMDNLVHLHSISNEKGFEYNDRFYSDWKTCFGSRVDKLYDVLNRRYKHIVSPAVFEMAHISYERFGDIFREPVYRSSLIHSDYNLWNILVDEESAKITGVIDPIDAGWADPEMDLFHLQNADGDRFELISRYQKKVELSELFEVKNAFYWFWDDIKHLQNMGWYQEERFFTFGSRLISLIEKHIG